MFFAVNGTAGTQLSIANMNFGGTYTDIQGSNQFAGKTPIIYFSQSAAPTWAVNCFQSFPNLTYGVTTAVESDPTITVQHNAVSAGGISISNLILYAAIVGGVASLLLWELLFLLDEENDRWHAPTYEWWALMLYYYSF